MQGVGPQLVENKGRTELSLREQLKAEFAALRQRLDAAEKRLLASMDADSTDAA